MTQGVLIYAFNNARIDYFRQATWCADRVNKFLDLPVTIVTDNVSVASRSTHHNIVFSEPLSGGNRIYNPMTDTTADTWFNANRHQSYDLSPYDQTLVLDSDYVVCSDRLNTLFNSGISITAMKNVYDITNRNGFLPYRTISGDGGLHHYWATVLYFEKSTISRDFFDIMNMIRDNYRHYADLYRFSTHPFRNDFSVSIALTTVYGHIPDNIPVIPWAMANVFNDVQISTEDQEVFTMEYDDRDKKFRRCIMITGEDFHFMNKVNLAKLYEHQI